MNAQWKVRENLVSPHQSKRMHSLRHGQLTTINSVAIFSLRRSHESLMAYVRRRDVILSFPSILVRAIDSLIMLQMKT